MVIEIELRKIIYLQNFSDTKSKFHRIIEKGAVVKEYSIYYSDSFRLNSYSGVVEYKYPKSKVAVYLDQSWFNIVTSVEIPHRDFTREQHRSFAFNLSHRQATEEYRLEVDLSKNAKFFAFFRSDGKCGLVFELEDYIDVSPYRHIYRKMDQFLRSSSSELLKPVCKFMQRKSVSHISEPLSSVQKKFFTAYKHDGIFGFVLCFKDRLMEYWEDQTSRRVVLDKRHPFCLRCQGICFSAEKTDDAVILLDVMSVGNVPTFRQNMKHILHRFFGDLTSSKTTFPEGYTLQKYYKYKDRDGGENLMANDKDEGIIYHTYDDEVYKLKKLRTVELLFENGRLQSFQTKFVIIDDDEFLSKGLLEEGKVYECLLVAFPNVVRVLRQRRDRFLCNNEEQIKDAIFR